MPARKTVSRKKITDASKTFESLSGRRATKAFVVHIPDPPEASVVVGELVSLVYRTKEGRRMVEYVHKFKTRPLLLTGENGRGLFVARGKFRITDRGIEG